MRRAETVERVAGRQPEDGTQGTEDGAEKNDSADSELRQHHGGGLALRQQGAEVYTGGQSQEEG